MVSKEIRVNMFLSMHNNSSYLVLVWAEAEVLDCLTSVLGTSEEKGVASGGSTESQLIQSQDLPSSSENASTSSGGNSESSNAELGDDQEAVVIGDGANNDNSALVLLAKVRNNSGNGDGGSVDAGHEKSAEDDLIEGGLGSAGQESVQLHKELEVWEISCQYCSRHKWSVNLFGSCVASSSAPDTLQPTQILPGSK